MANFIEGLYSKPISWVLAKGNIDNIALSLVLLSICALGPLFTGCIGVFVIDANPILIGWYALLNTLLLIAFNVGMWAYHKIGYLTWAESWPPELTPVWFIYLYSFVAVAIAIIQPLFASTAFTFVMGMGALEAAKHNEDRYLRKWRES